MKTLKLIQVVLLSWSLCFSGIALSSNSEVTIFNIDIPATNPFPVIKNRRGAKQQTIRPRSGNKVIVNILEERRGMYLITISKNGTKYPHKYLISKKWANRLLNVQAVLEANRIAALAKTGTDAPRVNPECEVARSTTPAPTVEAEAAAEAPALTSVPRPRPRPEGLVPEVENVPVPTPRPDYTPPATESYGGGGVCTNFQKYVDVFKNSGADPKALKQAIRYYQLNKSKFPNKRITVADFSLNSKKPRFFKINLATNTITPPIKVSHGSGNQGGRKYGDPNHDGNIDACHKPGTSRKYRNSKGILSNRKNMTRAGFFKTGRLYLSTVCSIGGKKSTCKKRGGRIVPRKNWPNFKIAGNRVNGMRLHGLNRDINDDSDATGVVMHEAHYNNNPIMGRSYGCPAFKPNEGRDLMDEIKGGSLYYSFVPKCSADMSDIEKSVPGWENTCVQSQESDALMLAGNNGGDLPTPDAVTGGSVSLTADDSAGATPVAATPTGDTPAPITATPTPKPADLASDNRTPAAAGTDNLVTILGRDAWGAAAFREDNSFKCMDYNQLFDLDANLSKEDKLKRIYNNGRIVVHHAAGPNGGPEMLRRAQSGHFSRGFQDISYHYLIDVNGRIYEGRSLEIMGAHAGPLPKSAYQCVNGNKVQDVSQDYDFKSIGIMLTGNFDEDQPRDAQYASLKSLIGSLQNRFGITRISPHKHVKKVHGGTACPGENLLKRIQRSDSGIQFEPAPTSTLNNLYPSKQCSAPSISCR
jgi:hypothetical protein